MTIKLKLLATPTKAASCRHTSKGQADLTRVNVQRITIKVRFFEYLVFSYFLNRPNIRIKVNWYSRGWRKYWILGWLNEAYNFVLKSNKWIGNQMCCYVRNYNFKTIHKIRYKETRETKIFRKCVYTGLNRLNHYKINNYGCQKRND